MSVELATIPLPDFGAPARRPDIPASEYEKRLADLRTSVPQDWIVVYADREHFANISFLTAFDPRFEEALLLLGPQNERFILVGNEDMSCALLVAPDIEMVLCQSFSLMGQDRSVAPKLEDRLRDLGVGEGASVAVVGWKYFEPGEHASQGFYSTVPSFVMAAIESVIGPSASIEDATHVLMAPDGMRARNSADQVAFLEWAATRTSRAVINAMAAAEPGRSEFEVVAEMGYAGEPLSAHVMFASGSGTIVGLRSPTDRELRHGDAVTTALGYWGGLTCRAGLLVEADHDFDRTVGRPYFAAIAAWYETVTVGAGGGSVVDAVTRAFAGAPFGSVLNPGHLIHLDEWVHSPMVPEGTEALTSGMALQCDIIPGPLGEGLALNCEDGVALADGNLRDEIRRRHPEVMERIDSRREFMRTDLGIEVSDDVLPLSSCPAYLSPFWLSRHTAYRKK